MNSRRIVRWFGVLVTIITTLAGSTSAWATNGYQLIGVGSYQKGMAGATTAAPHDAMCALSNPAGMALIGSRADFNMEMFNPNRRVDLSSFGGGANEGGSRMYGVPAIGWTAPAFNRTDVYFGGGMYGTSGLGVDYDVFDAGAFGQADIFTAIQFWKMAPTIAARVTDRLTLGIALNGDYQSVEINETFRGIALPGAPPVVSLDLARSPGTFGIGTTLGAMYKVHDRVNVGFSYSSQQYFQNTEYRLPAGAVTNFPQSTGTATNATAGRYDLDLNYPQQWVLGIAATPVDRWLVAFDVKWINWAATHDAVKLKGTFGLDTNGDGTADQTLSSISLPFGWDNQWVFAVGTQYQVTDAFAVRAGFNHAKAPIDAADVFNNLAFPAVVEDHLTLGATYRFGDHWEMSGAYKHALRNELTGKNDIPVPFQALAGTDSNAKIAMDQNSFGVQLSYRF
ncbi:MAG: outer membrane protein transport protein [Nitrospirae bacterium]|nr:outer membrane protein transport protein [Nitrospirota bacterium]